uniref:Secreted protein n=1 Tax=Trichuris muris TaxID=70415 RepID=A0A5S6Q696_TRIMR
MHWALLALFEVSLAVEKGCHCKADNRKMDCIRRPQPLVDNGRPLGVSHPPLHISPRNEAMTTSRQPVGSIFNLSLRKGASRRLWRLTARRDPPSLETRSAGKERSLAWRRATVLVGTSSCLKSLIGNRNGLRRDYERRGATSCREPKGEGGLAPVDTGRSIQGREGEGACSLTTGDQPARHPWSVSLLETLTLLRPPTSTVGDDRSFALAPVGLAAQCAETSA